MKTKLFLPLVAFLCSVFLFACSNENKDTLSNAEIASHVKNKVLKDNKIIFSKSDTQEKKNGEWKDNNDYIINGAVRGQILFDGNDCFYHYADVTFDPEAGGNIEGEFREIYDRKK